MFVGCVPFFWMYQVSSLSLSTIFSLCLGEGKKSSRNRCFSSVSLFIPELLLRVYIYFVTFVHVALLRIALFNNRTIQRGPKSWKWKESNKKLEAIYKLRRNMKCELYQNMLFSFLHLSHSGCHSHSQSCSCRSNGFDHKIPWFFCHRLCNKLLLYE